MLGIFVSHQSFKIPQTFYIKSVCEQFYITYHKYGKTDPSKIILIEFSNFPELYEHITIFDVTLTVFLKICLLILQEGYYKNSRRM